MYVYLFKLCVNVTHLICLSDEYLVL